ncbi:hypothetical protein O181_002029 [Austropuccinia psidii MF-1]|uniref:Uncharacterized protein n=1 Tax=Austropuccinia psidii MF-1 TaxID=1389203 RepID=A0A9Q3BBK5_9BASI|nr:hypothetical protein [Austropuccinia psidii MF-1]
MLDLSSFPSFEWDLSLINTPKGEDLILVFDFLNHFNPSIDWRQGLITFKPNHKNYHYPSQYFSNDSSSSNTCSALIKDVGEDNLFHGNLNLPHTSYHDSLEYLWDEVEEPEEIETLIKVVPSAYHQYLDLFSKVKEENLPPHHACDHHITLKESLPPVGVIYSLSNQDSETLRA